MSRERERERERDRERERERKKEREGKRMRGIRTIHLISEILKFFEFKLYLEEFVQILKIM